MTSGDASSEMSAVYSRYSYGVDQQLAAVIESCFTPDGSIGVVGSPPTTGPRAISTRLVGIADPAVVHHAFNIVVLEGTPDSTRARADFTMSKAGSVIATGHYDDSLVRHPEDGWLFRRRSVMYTWRATSS